MTKGNSQIVEEYVHMQSTQPCTCRRGLTVAQWWGTLQPAASSLKHAAV